MILSSKHLCEYLSRCLISVDDYVNAHVFGSRIIFSLVHLDWVNKREHGGADI